MLNQIKLKNFKCFENETTFPIRQINLLTAVNGSGKSTFLQSLLLMWQSIQDDHLTTRILLNGIYVNLGRFDDIKNSGVSKSEPIIFEYTVLKNEHLVTWTYSFCEAINDDMVADIELLKVTNYNQVDKTISSDNISRKDMSCELFEFSGLIPRYFPQDIAAPNFNHIHYVSADRLGPQDIYSKSTVKRFPSVGSQGEFTANILDKMKEHLVNDKLCLGNYGKILSNQVAEWLNKIFDGGNVEIRSSTNNWLEILFNTSSSKDRFKSTNVGFGYSSILPIVVSGLIAKEGEILIVENPEIHLHPKAQSRIAQFLAQVSSCGVQVFIESHSDHILNGFQIAVLDKIITEDEMNVLYFQRDNQEPVIQIPIKKNGRIDVWPEGFFDQSNKDLERIFGM
jgi:predicted ATPase